MKNVDCKALFETYLESNRCSTTNEKCRVLRDRKLYSLLVYKKNSTTIDTTNEKSRLQWCITISCQTISG